MFDGDTNTLGDFFCLLDLALITCVEEERLEEHQRQTIKFINDVWPASCKEHTSSQGLLLFKINDA